MTDDRPRPQGAVEPVIEVPLSGGVDGRADDSTERRDAPNWGRFAPLGIALGVALGVTIAVIVLSGDDSDSDATPTTERGDQTDLTTPPTLSPLETLPPATINRPEPETEETTSQDRELFDPPTIALPSYPTADIEAAAELPPGLDDQPETFFESIVRLGDDLPRRSTTIYRLGERVTFTVSILRDPVNDRHEVTVLNGVQVIRLVAGGADERFFVESAPGSWTAFASADVLMGTGAETIGELFDRLMLGPIRPDTLGLSSFESTRLVTFDDGVTAREWSVHIPSESIPEWRVYALGPIGTAPPPTSGEVSTYSVYVDEDGMIARVNGLSDVAGAAQMILHEVEAIEQPIVVELPDPTTVASLPDRRQP